MKFLIVFVALFAVALAAPTTNEAEVLKQVSAVAADKWSNELQTSDGTSISQNGVIEKAGTENEAAVVRGSYSWVSPEGETFTVTYVADENGYQPQGAHLPVAPVV